MLWHIEYPEQDQPLFANVNEASGWCFHEAELLQSMELLIDGRRESEAILGYPRMDVSSRYPQAEGRSLLSGFRCAFDPGRLAPGPHTFEFQARTATANATLTRSVLKQRNANPVLVTDVFIDIVGSCNLRCAMCPHGNLEGIGASRTMGVMPPRLFERIIRHLRDSGILGEYVNLYNWGEPMLHPHLEDILDVCRRFDVKAIISSNLSVPERRLDPLKSRPVDLLMVSISGFTQEIYAKNHSGGNLARVLKNLSILASHRDTVRTVLVKFLVFKHNAHQIEPAKRFALEHGFEFGAYAGVIPSIESYSCVNDNESYARASDTYVHLSTPLGRATQSCPQETKIVIDHEGRLEHCSMAWNRPYANSVLDADIRAYLLGKLKNQDCRACMDSGYSHYRHYGAYSPELLQLSTATPEPLR